MGSLIDVLTLEQLDANLFRSRFHEENVSGSLFGGQVLGQALMAAQSTVDGRLPHSMHAYFLRAGTSATPVIYDVDRIRDGGSFTTRRVVAIQNGKAILNMAASFHQQEEGHSHQMAAFDMPPQPTEADYQAVLKKFNDLGMSPRIIARFQESKRIEVMPVYVDAYLTEQQTPPKNLFWFRCPEPLPDDPAMQRSGLAYASDLNLIATSLFPHPTSLFSGKEMLASLDHAVWFHDTPNVHEWQLYQTDSPWAGGGRGYNRGLIYSPDGKLMASTSQEGLIRPIKKSP